MRVPPGSEVPLLEQVLRIKGLRPPPSAARAHHIKHLLSTRQGPSCYAHVNPVLHFCSVFFYAIYKYYTFLWIVLVCVIFCLFHVSFHIKNINFNLSRYYLRHVSMLTDDTWHHRLCKWLQFKFVSVFLKTWWKKYEHLLAFKYFESTSLLFQNSNDEVIRTFNIQLYGLWRRYKNRTCEIWYKWDRKACAGAGGEHCASSPRFNDRVFTRV